MRANKGRVMDDRSYFLFQFQFESLLSLLNIKAQTQHLKSPLVNKKREVRKQEGFV